MLYPPVSRVEHRQHSRTLGALAHLDTARQYLVLSATPHTHRNKDERSIERIENFNSLYRQLTFAIVRVGNRQQCRTGRQLNARPVALNAQSFPDE